MANIIIDKKVSEVEKFSQGIVVDDQAVEASAMLNFNSNKGLVKITVNINDSMITGNEDDDTGMLLKVNQVVLAAIKRGMELKSDWTEQNGDPNQLKFGFGQADESTEDYKPVKKAGRKAAAKD